MTGRAFYILLDLLPKAIAIVVCGSVIAIGYWW